MTEIKEGQVLESHKEATQPKSTLAIVYSFATEANPDVVAAIAGAKDAFENVVYLVKTADVSALKDMLESSKGGEHDVVLLVDDTASIRLALARIIKRAIQREVISFSDYIDAIDSLELEGGILTLIQEEQRRKVSVIIMDVQGHELPPIKFMQKLKAK